MGIKMIKQDIVYRHNGSVVHIGEWDYIGEGGDVLPVNPEWVKSMEDVEAMSDGSRVAVNDYKSRRKYPPVGEQLDALWHAMDSGDLPKINGFYNLIKDVKDSDPKG